MLQKIRKISLSSKKPKNKGQVISCQSVKHECEIIHNR